MTCIATMKTKRVGGNGLLTPGIILCREHLCSVFGVDSGDAAEVVGKGIIESTVSLTIVEDIDDTTIQIVEVTCLSILRNTLIAIGIECGTDGGAIML